MGWVVVEEADQAFEVVLRGRCSRLGMVEVVPCGILIELSIEDQFEA
jgi:hypothetical protein